MNRRKLLIIVTTVFALCSSLFAKGDTYIYDYWGEIEKSPDVYRLLDVMYASDFDLDVNLRNPSGLFANGNLIYLVDTDNNISYIFIFNTFINDTTTYAFSIFKSVLFPLPFLPVMNAKSPFFIRNETSEKSFFSLQFPTFFLILIRIRI